MSHRVCHLVQLVVAKPVGYLLPTDQLIDAGADPRLHLIAQPAAGKGREQAVKARLILTAHQAHDR